MVCMCRTVHVGNAGITSALRGEDAYSTTAQPWFMPAGVQSVHPCHHILQVSEPSSAYSVGPLSCQSHYCMQHGMHLLW